MEFQSKIEVTNKISAQCQERFQELKLRRKHRYIVFKMGEEEIEVEVVGVRNETYDQFTKKLPYSECRFAVFDQDYKTHDGRPASKLWFVSWFPNSSTTHMKMAYAAAKGKFRETLLGVFDTQVANLEELDTSLGLGDNEDEEDEGFDF